MSKYLSPYRFDLMRYISLVARPNLTLDSFSAISAPDDSVFPETGLLVFKGCISKDLCEKAVEEYDVFEKYRLSKNCHIHNELGRNYRLVNFHLKSDALLSIGLTNVLHEAVSKFFRRPSSIYTSLFYKHGSQQDAHIDTPFFWTRPFNLYTGVWVALEDVSENAGPLFYYPGSHNFFNSEKSLTDLYLSCNKDLNTMFSKMREAVEVNLKPVRLILKKGDAVIWHPGILHGGTLANDPFATRYSAVFHFAPLGVNVRMNDTFPMNFYNYPKYGVMKKYNNYYCRGSLPKVML
jgi:hypothetical protein